MVDPNLRARIRRVESKDVGEAVRMRSAMWPDAREIDHQSEVRAYVAHRPKAPLDGAMYVCEREKDAGLCGFIEVSLRISAEGCFDRSPVGYIEGWYVDPDVRGCGVGALLVAAGEQWARARGCTEMGSDAVVANTTSHAAHIAVGYEEIARVVHFRKRLVAVDDGQS